MEKAELDPLSTNAGTADPTTVPSLRKLSLYPGWGDSIMRGDSQCMWGDLELPCDMRAEAINSRYIHPDQQRGHNGIQSNIFFKFNFNFVRFDNAAEHGDSVDDSDSPLWFGGDSVGDTARGHGFFAFTTRTTQKPIQETDCQVFANIVEQIAQFSANADLFMQHMVLRFIGPDLNSQSRADFDRAVNIGRNEFGSSGFKQDFVDSSNQVRHFTGGLWAGYLYGPGIGELGMNTNEDSTVSNGRGVGNTAGGILPTLWPTNDSRPDVALNSVSVPLGASLTPTPEQMVDRGDRGGWRRISANPGYKGLAGAIRAKVCD